MENYSIQAEQMVLGTLLESPDSFDYLPTELDVNDFSASNGKIFRIICDFIENGIKFDLFLVAEELSKTGDDQLAYLTDLQMSAHSAKNISAHGQLIYQAAIDREIFKLGSQIQKMSSDKDISPENKLEQIGSLVNSVERAGEGDSKDFNDLLRVAIKTLDNRFRSGEGFKGLRTGFKDLDENLQGLDPGDLVILAARPGMGKTALALNICLNQTFEGKNVLVFSLEMPADQLINRMISSTSQVDGKRIKTGKLLNDDWGSLEAGVGRLLDKDIKIFDKSSQSIGYISAICRRQNRKRKVDLVVIDYLQLVSAKAHSRVEEVSIISRRLKSLAKDLECPVLALSQLNRDLEKRPNKRPVISDLRESGSIEQDADKILFIYRDEHYDENSPEKGIAEISTAKHRSGETGTVRLQTKLQYSLFVDLDPSYQPPQIAQPGGFRYAK